MRRYVCWEPESSERESALWQEQWDCAGGAPWLQCCRAWLLGGATSGCEEGFQCHPHTSASTTYLHTVITSPFCHQCSTVLTPWPVSVFYSQALIVVFECSLAFFSSWKKKTLLTLLTNLCYKPDLSPTIYPRYLMFPRLSSSYLCSPGMEHAWVPFCDSNLDLQSRSGKCSLLSPGNLQIGWENEILISLVKNIFSIHCRAFPLLP